MWNRHEFKAGDRVARADGAWAEVLSVSEDGERLRVRFTGEGPDTPPTGTEGEIGKDEVVSLSPAAPSPEWDERVAVVVHRVPETEESEGGYAAVTMAGTPLGVSVEAEDAESASVALDRLMGSLKAFGFAGTVAVEDTTRAGSVRRHEVQVP